MTRPFQLGETHDTVPDEDGVEYAMISFDTPGKTDIVYCLPDQGIPVVFLPGIMGSPLIATGDNRGIWDDQGKWAWFPDNGSWMVTGYGNLESSLRRQLLNPSAVRALEHASEADDETLQKHVTGLAPLEASRRGWGSVMLGSYGGLLSFLEANLRRVMYRGTIPPSTEAARPASPQDWGELRGYERLSDAEIRQAAKWRFPVYAVGYNWLASSGENAELLKQRIEAIRADCRTRLGVACDKVILVTHSMGGLVARRYAQLYPDDVLGIVHGVQPAIGAATAYARVRGGWESSFKALSPWESTKNAVGAWALGPTGAEVTTVFANAAGPLELLPNRQYGRHWLSVEYGKGAARQMLFSLPEKDPYAEIYGRGDVWWRLVHPGLINPVDSTPQGVQKAWGDYLEQLRIAKRFHDRLGNYYHPATYAYCGVDLDEPAWHRINWRLESLREIATGLWGRSPLAATIRDGAQLTADAMRGSCEIVDRTAAGNVMLYRDGQGVMRQTGGDYYRAWLSGQDGPGDATVPAHSGLAPRPNVPFFAQMRGFDHQGSYQNPKVQLVTLYSILKLATLAQPLP